MAAVTILAGDNQLRIRARRAELLAASGAPADAVARFDLADAGEEAGFATALATIPMFGGPRYLEAFPAALLSEELAALLRSLPAGDTVVLHGEKAPAAALIKTAKADLETHKSPTGANLRTMVADLAAEHELELTADQVSQVAARCAGDVARVQSVIYSLAVTAQTRPTDVVLERYLAGSTASPGTPWALTDQLSQGHIGVALSLVDTVEPLAVLAYVATRLGQMGRILEDNLGSAEQVASATGLASVTSARSLLTLAHRIGPAGLAASWDVVTRADVAAKSSNHPRAALELALCELHQLWTGTPVAALAPAGW